MPRKPKSSGTAINKTNLPTGQAYGARGGEMRSLQAMPVPQQSDPVAAAQPTAQPTGAGAATSPAPVTPQEAAANMPFTPVGLGDPTQRPGEPITSGLPTGPGSNQPPALIAPQSTPQDQTLALLLAAQRANPTPGLEALIARYQVINGLS